MYGNPHLQQQISDIDITYGNPHFQQQMADRNYFIKCNLDGRTAHLKFDPTRLHEFWITTQLSCP